MRGSASPAEPAPHAPLVAPAPGPPGLGGLLMVVGGAVCVAGGLFMALGAQIVEAISPEAATVLLKVTPVVAGGVLVVVGARVRRALGQAYARGLIDGSKGAVPPGARLQPPQEERAGHGSATDR